jgi:ionotropic glutamate receptor
MLFISCDRSVHNQHLARLALSRFQEMPYVMRKRDANLTGNDRFEGFCIDLLKTIAENLGFQYQLYLVPDGKFGAEDVQSKQWNGLVRELMDKVRSFYAQWNAKHSDH